MATSTPHRSKEVLDVLRNSKRTQRSVKTTIPKRREISNVRSQIVRSDGGGGDLCRASATAILLQVITLTAAFSWSFLALYPHWRLGIGRLYCDTPTLRTVARLHETRLHTVAGALDIFDLIGSRWSLAVALALGLPGWLRSAPMCARAFHRTHKHSFSLSLNVRPPEFCWFDNEPQPRNGSKCNIARTRSSDLSMHHAELQFIVVRTMDFSPHSFCTMTQVQAHSQTFVKTVRTLFQPSMYKYALPIPPLHLSLCSIM